MRSGAAGFVACLVALPAAALIDPVPVAQVDFEASYITRLLPDDDMPGRIFIRHSGGWYRHDIEYANPQLRNSGFSREGYAGAIFIAEVGRNKLALRVLSIRGDPIADLWGQQGTRLDSTEMIGERCTYWRIEPASSEVQTRRRLIACITADGVPLSVAIEGYLDKPLLRAEKMQRRPQNPAWFTMPQGVKLRDVPDIDALEREVAAWARTLGVSRRK